MSETQRSPLDKPVWIRVVGWLALVCFLVPICIPLAEVLSHTRIPRTVWPGYCDVAFFPLWIVWSLATMIHRVHKRRAEQNARALIEAAKLAELRAKQNAGR